MSIFLLFNLVLELPGVAHVMPNSFHTLQNTRSWDYLGLSSHSPTNLMHDTKMGDGIVIGIIDTGIWPESKHGSVRIRRTLQCHNGLQQKTSRSKVVHRWFPC